MFTNVSMAGVGAVITVLFTVLKMFGIEVPEEAGANLTEAIGTVIGLVLLVWGQLRRPDLIAGIVRK